MKYRAQKVTVFLEGGTGNQLFTYTAGLYLANKNSCQLRVVDSLVGAFGPNHGSYLAETNLPGDFVSYGIAKSVLYRIIFRGVKSLCRRSSNFRKLIFTVARQYHSREIGFDICALNLKPPVSLFGYFQSCKYLEDSMTDVFQNIELENPSDWFTQTSIKMKLVNPIVIHVRRGDYKSHIESFGILGSDYYKIGLNEINPFGNQREVWVFSDEIEEAKVLLDFGDSYKFNWIIPPSNSSPLESLLLMSQAASIIISNSTFSFWAAAIGNPNKCVVAPVKWFKGLQDPAEMLPKRWIRVASSWL
jgi:hypothetical protein